MELHEIRYFLALSRTLNFTKAAKACNVGQPALSRAIRRMEEELGGLLFSRGRNKTHLTELGRLIEPHLSEAVARTSEAKVTAERFLKLDRANLTLGVMCTVAPVRFVSFLGRFHLDNPGIEITLLERVADELCDLLARGELNVALLARPDGFASPLQAFELYSERFVIACSAGHRFATRDKIAVNELDGEFYLSRINCEFQDILGEICDRQNVNLIESYRSEREDWILTMVAAGLNICFLPEFTAIFPGIVSCPVLFPSVARQVCLVTVAGRPTSAPVKALIDAVRSYPWPSQDANASACDLRSRED
jgi:LysR family transcriptional regulator, hydrogen peroxide-inducible genes activator